MSPENQKNTTLNGNGAQAYNNSSSTTTNNGSGTPTKKDDSFVEPETKKSNSSNGQSNSSGQELNKPLEVLVGLKDGSAIEVKNNGNAEQTDLFRRLEVLAGLILIPVATIVIGWIQFNTQQTQEKHTILKEYIDNISSLNLEKDLTQDDEEEANKTKKIKDTIEQIVASQPTDIKQRLEVIQSMKNAKDLSETANDARTMAMGQTKTTLRRLDGEYKGYVIRFLHESNLIKDKIKVEEQNKENNFVEQPVIPLSGANIDEVILKDAWLPNIQLEGAYIRKADFSNANLQGANLQGANLQGANLQNVKLTTLIKFKTISGKPVPVEFISTNLQGTDFRGAKNLKAEQVVSAKNWEQACYDSGFIDKNLKVLQRTKPGLTRQALESNCNNK